MKRIDHRTVELTDTEISVKDSFDYFLNRGHGIPVAAKLALNRHRFAARGTSADEFITWLSEGTVIRRGSRAHVLPEWQTIR